MKKLLVFSFLGMFAFAASASVLGVAFDMTVDQVESILDKAGLEYQTKEKGAFFCGEGYDGKCVIIKTDGGSLVDKALEISEGKQKFFFNDGLLDKVMVEKVFWTNTLLSIRVEKILTKLKTKYGEPMDISSKSQTKREKDRVDKYLWNTDDARIEFETTQGTMFTLRYTKPSKVAVSDDL